MYIQHMSLDYQQILQVNQTFSAHSLKVFFLFSITCHKYLYSSHPVPEHLSTEGGSCTTTETSGH